MLAGGHTRPPKGSDCEAAGVDADGPAELEALNVSTTDPLTPGGACVCELIELDTPGSAFDLSVRYEESVWSLV